MDPSDYELYYSSIEVLPILLSEAGVKTLNVLGGPTQMLRVSNAATISVGYFYSFASLQHSKLCKYLLFDRWKPFECTCSSRRHTESNSERHLLLIPTEQTDFNQIDL